MATNLFTTTIAADASLSTAVNLRGTMVLSILMPAQWTTAVVTAYGSLDGGQTFYPVVGYDGEPVTFAASSGVVVSPTDPLALLPFSHIKLLSGTTALPVTQTAERAITVVTEELA